MLNIDSYYAKLVANEVISEDEIVALLKEYKVLQAATLEGLT
ncbi:hypothetical protein [Rhodoferax antarcticus]|uniref:Uncharacterized protein n=1 Tax=Rhodoferax antarcticus ANT.BR TaxID=1111071 RepID=A0A1Q8Y8S7_9BURK|nr:hypothetical protein [Rhodoferax antarcticus]OLP04456.1 hypothetical protein BLL52_4261 [Rhodoferax antarcticus ANT.BR]